jgi:transposase
MGFMLVQGLLRHDPFSGHLFVFRGRRANLIKIAYWDRHRSVPLHQAAGAWCFPVAIKRRAERDDDADVGAIIDAD